MTELTHLSLFSGIGGLDLAAEAAGFISAGQCEWADYPTKVLEKHWPNVPRWRDIRTLTGDDFYARTGRRSVTVISGGFPCQPFSVAGKQRGKEDDRYLWPEMCRVISEIRPAWVIGENVPGIVNLALDEVLSDLESQGYTCQTFIIPAAGVEAPHKRDRIVIIAYSDRNARDKRWPKSEGQQRQTRTANGGDDVADPNQPGLQRRQRRGLQECTGEWAAGPCDSFFSNTESAKCSGRRREARRWRAEFGCDSRGAAESGLGSVADGIPDWMGGYWPTEPEGIPRTATGIPHRVDQLKCYGNAVVPQQFYPFFRYIAEIEKSAYWREGE